MFSTLLALIEGHHWQAIIRTSVEQDWYRHMASLWPEVFNMTWPEDQATMKLISLDDVEKMSACHRNMMTSSNGNFSTLLAICAGNSPVPGEFPAQRPVTRSFGVFFDLRQN